MLQTYLEETIDQVIEEIVSDVTDEMLVLFLQDGDEPIEILSTQVEESIEITVTRVLNEWLNKGLKSDLMLTE